MEENPDRRLLWLWLSLACGPASPTAERLLDHFETVEAIYEAGADDYAAVPRIEKRVLEKLTDKSLLTAGEVNAYCQNEGIGILTLDSPLYPSRLARIRRKPILLYYKGILTELDREVCIAEVGTRSMTEYGSRAAYSVAYDMAKAGAVVVSGMAKGVDGMAHRGALDAGGYTVAVLGCGIDRAYPAEHAGLMQDIIRQGLVLTEYEPFSKPEGWHFPQRNRVISGLSLAAVVVEAPTGSGALITARTALEQGRDVYALPGKVGEHNSIGTNELIREGASLVTGAADILTVYQPFYPGKINLNHLTEIRSKQFHSPIGRVAAPRPFREPPSGASGTDGPTEKQDGGEPEKTKPAKKSLLSLLERQKEKRRAENEAPPSAPPEAPAEKEAPEPPPRDFGAFPEKQKRILTALSENGPLDSDHLAAILGIPIPDLMAEITMLEISGEINAMPGGLYGLTETH